MNILRLISQRSTATLVMGFLALVIPMSVSAQQQNQQYIYGTIETNSGDVYEGFMRWGKEEMTWTDVFNSEKSGSQHRVRKGKSSQWGDFEWSFGSIWKDKYQGSGHLFACFFGDIKTIVPGRSDRVELTLKNGSVIRVDGGSNDIGATIRMLDYELGIIKFDWDRINKIEFFQAPASRKPRYGRTLYGTAHTRRGKTYTGYIKWDNDERCGNDILDGDSRNGDQQIPFEGISVIEKDDDGSQVTFKSGRSLFLDGSNDVSDGNRGVHIYQVGVGSVEIPWKHFEKLELDQDPPPGPAFDDFVTPKPITGEVVMFNGKKHYGQIIFDLDEMWDMEMLDGDDDYVKYQVPFRNIRRIIPKNRSYSLVILKNGEELLLGDGQDVSNRNNGLMVVTDSDKDAITIDWDDIDEIHFY